MENSGEEVSGMSYLQRRVGKVEGRVVRCRGCWEEESGDEEDWGNEALRICKVAYGYRLRTWKAL